MNRRVYCETERAPCGTAGGLLSLVPPISGRSPDLSDVLVSRPKPFRLTLWEPLRTLAPSPALCQPHVCYLNTVIFYARPHVVRQHSKLWRSRDGWKACPPGGSFEEYDRAEYRLRWDDIVEYQNDQFSVSGGRVVWHGGRWWMMHSARRQAA